MCSCSKCGKEFQHKPTSKLYEIDGLCSKCRSLLPENLDKLRKTKECPVCGKLILKSSDYCNRCSQLGELNRMYTDGHSITTRTCNICGKPISVHASNGVCNSCRDRSGDKNPNYRGSECTSAIYNTSEYFKWRFSIYRRDNYTCKCCGCNDGGIDAHHIYPKSKFPDLIFVLSNGITLCKKCHHSIYSRELKFAELFTELIASS
jgi:hypothetical protein